MGAIETLRDWPRFENRLFLPSEMRLATKQPTDLDGAVDRLLNPRAPRECPKASRDCQEGYFNLGMIAVKQFQGATTADPALVGLGYPTLFLFRHYIELSLKNLERRCAKLESREPSARLRNCHDLTELWAIAKKSMEDAFPPQPHDDKTLENVGRCICEFHSVDPKSFSFRYAGEKSVNDGHETIPPLELSRFAEAMSGLHAFFHGCDAYADHLQVRRVSSDSCSGK